MFSRLEGLCLVTKYCAWDKFDINDLYVMVMAKGKKVY